VFVGLKPSMALSDLVRDVKNNSTNFINDHAWIKGKFCWQEGYGAFSYSSQQNVYNYILNQSTTARRHFKLNRDFLKKFEVEHDVNIFEWIDEDIKLFIYQCLSIRCEWANQASSKQTISSETTGRKSGSRA
jgi:hypothetical protein